MKPGRKDSSEIYESAFDPHPIRILTAILAHLRNGSPIDEEDKSYFVGACERFLSGGASLDREMRLVRRGGVSLRQQVKNAWRDDLLVRCWSGCEQFNGHPPLVAAKLMVCSWRRFDRVPRARRQSRPVPTDEPEATWWRLQNQHVKVLTSKRVQSILERGR